MPLYTFSCFRAPETICKKLDSIVSDFWWGHDQGVRKMHMLHWDKICLNRREGGIGYKKFSIINQSMLAKQFWTISHNPESLLAKTFKAKYFPRCSIHDSSPKPHHSWFWRNIIKQGNPKLREGRWWVGKGLDIPLNHPDWFQCPTQNLQNPNLLTGTVADLIDHNTGVWKADLVRAVYLFLQCSEILSIPISKTGGVSDKLLWKYSRSGEYKVKNAYNLLLKDSTQTSHHYHRPTQFPPEVWNLIWKVNVPHKVGLFVWKLMHDSLPAYLTLRNRGIPTTSSLPSV